VIRRTVARFVKRSKLSITRVHQKFGFNALKKFRAAQGNEDTKAANK
jgi:hypothetical protein